MKGFGGCYRIEVRELCGLLLSLLQKPCKSGRHSSTSRTTDCMEVAVGRDSGTPCQLLSGGSARQSLES